MRRPVLNTDDEVEAALDRVRRRRAAAAAHERGEPAPSLDELREQFREENRKRRNTPPPRKLTLRERVVMTGKLALFLGLPAGMIATVVFGGPAYDSAHRVTVRCTIASAEAITVSSSSRTVSVSSGAVAIDSSPCGRLLIEHGVGFSNNEQVAASFRHGDTYAFVVGGGTYRWREFLGAFRIRPSVYEYHRL